MFVAVVGGDTCSEEIARMAEAVGRELARRGVVLVCGGRGGVMEAACRGAKAAGGTTVGILPGPHRSEANPYVDIPIATGLGEARNVIVVKSAQAVIAIDGEFGTLSEIALSLRNRIPVIGLRTWSLSKEGKADESIVVATSPIDAVEKAIAAARQGEQHTV
jgi:hypothetical protein